MSPDARVGLVALLAIVVAVATVVFVRGEGLLRRPGYELTILFDDTGGVEAQTPVRMAGVAIGRVKAVTLARDYKAQVTIAVGPDVRIPQGSHFAVATAGLIGDRFISVAPGPPEAAPIAPGAEVRGEEPFSVERLTERFEGVADRVETLLDSVNNLVADPEMRENLRQVLRDARDAAALTREATANVVQTTARVQRLVDTDVAATGRNLRQMSSILVETASRLEDFVAAASEEGALARDVRESAASLRQASQRIATMAADLQRLVNSENVGKAQEIVDEARETVRDARTLVRRANAVLERVGGILPSDSTGRLLRFDYEVWYAGERAAHGIDVWLLPEAEHLFRLGVHDIGATNGVVLQYGRRFGPNLRGRAGVYESQGGVGVDYRLFDPFWVSLDLYNPNRLTLDAVGRYGLNSHWYLTLGGRDLLRQPLFLLGAGIRY